MIMLSFAAVIAGMWFDRKFPRELTLWSAVIWIVPLAAKNDLMSFSRYMSVSFPVFLFLGLRAGWMRFIIIAIYATGYLFALGAIIRYAWLA